MFVEVVRPTLNRCPGKLAGLAARGSRPACRGGAELIHSHPAKTGRSTASRGGWVSRAPRLPARFTHYVEVSRCTMSHAGACNSLPPARAAGLQHRPGGDRGRLRVRSGFQPSVQETRWSATGRLAEGARCTGREPGVRRREAAPGLAATLGRQRNCRIGRGCRDRSAALQRSGDRRSAQNSICCA